MKKLIVLIAVLVPALASAGPVNVNGQNTAIDAAGTNGNVSINPNGTGAVHISNVTNALRTEATPPALTYQIAAVATAAASAGIMLPDGAPIGASYVVYNNQANSQFVWAGTAGTINGSTAGYKIPLATKAVMTCLKLSATAWACYSGVIPTPAAP